MITLLVVGALAALIVGAQARRIRRNESGLAVEKFAARTAMDRLATLHAEAGMHAKMLAPGWHFGLWRWQYDVVRFPVVSNH